MTDDDFFAAIHGAADTVLGPGDIIPVVPVAGGWGVRVADVRAALRRTTPAPTMLLPGEAARRLHVNIRTLRRWGEAGRLYVERTDGGHRRYRAADVDALAAAARRGGAQ